MTLEEKEEKLINEIIEALRPLTPQRRKYVVACSLGLSRKEAVMISDFKPEYNGDLMNAPHRIPQVHTALKKFDEAAIHGLTKDYFYNKHRNLSEAKKTITHNGELVEVPDNATQFRCLELGYKVLGVLQEDTTVTIETHEQRMRRLRGDGCE